MSEIPEDIMQTSSEIVADWFMNRPSDPFVNEMAKAILAERERCAKIADRFMEMHIAESIRNPKP